MIRPGDHDPPESEQDFEHMREKNDERRCVNPEEPGTTGGAHHGVLSNREPAEHTKAGSGTNGSQPKRRNSPN
jgi:hypothetical protein